MEKRYQAIWIDNNPSTGSNSASNKERSNNSQIYKLKYTSSIARQMTTSENKQKKYSDNEVESAIDQFGNINKE